MILKKLTVFAVLLFMTHSLLASCGADSGTASTDIGTASTDSGTAYTDSGTASTDIGTASTDSATASTDSATASTDSGLVADASALDCYDFSKPVPECAKKDISWFDDALFIGDSRIGGFQMLAGVYNAQYITFPGMAVDKFFTWEFYPKADELLTAAEALDAIPKSYTKVYINLGLNELGWYPYFDPFYNKLCDVIDAVRARNADADIYLISVLPVSRERSEKVSWETLENIDAVNSKIRQAATEKQAFYLEIDTVFRDTEGYLPADYSNDGVHLNSGPLGLFRDYLLTHTVEE